MFLLRVFLLVVLCRSSQHSVLKTAKKFNEEFYFVSPSQDIISDSRSSTDNSENSYDSPSTVYKATQRISHGRDLNNDAQYSELVIGKGTQDAKSQLIHHRRASWIRTNATKVPVDYSGKPGSVLSYYTGMSDGPLTSPLANRLHWVRMWPTVMPNPLPEPLPRGTLPPDASVCDLCPKISSRYNPLDPCTVRVLRISIMDPTCTDV